MHALLLAVALGALAPSADRPIALTGATIVDVSASGKNAADIRDAVVVIRGNEIVAAGPRRKTKIPADAQIIRVDGAYIVPGLNDVFAGLNSQAQANAYLGIDAFVHTRRYSLELAAPELRAAVANAPFGPARTTFYEYLAALDPDAPVVKDWAARLAASRVALIPTLSMSYLDLPRHENPWKEEIAAILDPAGIHLPADRETGAWQQDPGIPAGSSVNLMRIEERYARAGARYLAGSGTSAFGTLPGISLHRELQILTSLGLTPRQALAAATSNVGETFRWPRVGHVKKGFDADVLVLDADPTKDIANLKKIRLVIHDGAIVDRDALRKAQATGGDR